MKYTIFIILLAVGAALLSGCQGPQTRAMKEAECPGKSTIDEAVGLLTLQKQNVQPFRAAADCIIALPAPKGGLKRENVPGTVFFVPPDKILFAGSKFGEVGFGANEAEFWLRVKPDMDTYWWGNKAQAAHCTEAVILNPADMAEAFGIVNITTDWKLWHRDNFDILDLTEDGKHKKRVYVNACDYRVEKIEYFDDFQMKTLAVELSNYTVGNQGLIIPRKIHIGHLGQDGREEAWLELQLKQVAPFVPTEKQREKLFVRPPRDGYKEVLRLNELCEFELE